LVTGEDEVFTASTERVIEIVLGADLEGAEYVRIVLGRLLILVGELRVNELREPLELRAINTGSVARKGI
jgi:hypothetical protein